jgi:hypothetical protein
MQDFAYQSTACDDDSMVERDGRVSTRARGLWAMRETLSNNDWRYQCFATQRRRSAAMDSICGR